MITITNVNKHPNTDVLTVDISEVTKNVTIQTNEDGEKFVIGDGIFDNLMETATKHLDAQWNNQRIRGEQYADVYEQIYIKTLELALNAWIQKPKAIADTLLTLDNIDKTNAETDLIKEQTVHEKLKEELTKCQTKLTCEQYNHELLKEDLTEANTANVTQDTKVKVCQEKLVCAQATHEASKQDLTEANTANVEADTEVKECQRQLTCNQATHELEKIELTEAQTTLTERQIDDVIAGAQLKGAQAYLAKCQADAALAQVELVGAQVQSESEKLELYKAQAKGYEENIKYQVFKACLETWGMGFSVANSAFEQVPIPMNNACINMMAKGWFDDLFGVNINFNKDVSEANSGYKPEED